MEKNSIYKIPIVALKNKVHHFEYKIDGTFFNDFENSVVTDLKNEDSNIEIKVSLEKRDRVIVLLFAIDGNINLVCDRCLDHYKQEVFGDYKLIIQFGGEINQDNDDDDDIILIPANSDFIDVSKPIYDYILLSIPIQHIHSNLDKCNKEMISFLNKEKEKKQEIDPRWEILNKLKNK